MRIFIAFIFFMRISSIYGQSCGCNILTTDLFKKFENNYVNADKLVKRNKYKVFKEKLIEKSKKSKNCLLEFYELLSFINDKHVYAINDHTADSNFHPKKMDSVHIDELYNYYKSYKGKFNSIEGIWVNEKQEYEFLVMKNKFANSFTAVIIKSPSPQWRKGYVKAIFYLNTKKPFVDYFQLNYTEIIFPVGFNKNIIDIDPIGKWIRKGISNRTERDQELHENVPTFKIINDENVILKIPSFRMRKGMLDSILNSNRGILDKTKHLVIDLRGNMGGAIGHYKSILPLLYTNPMWEEGAYFKSSIDNINFYAESLENRDDTGSTNYYESKRLLEKMRSSPDSKIMDSGYYVKYDRIYEFPKRVSVLIDDKSASAAELFLIMALQSKKVTIFGKSNTRGAGDKLDVILHSLVCKNYKVTIPSSLRVKEVYKKDIDNIGISPNVLIPHNEKPYNFIFRYQSNH